MRIIKAKERKRAGNFYCSFCKPAKVDAIWRKSGIGCDFGKDLACDIHKHLIKEPIENEHLTEADYQTWMRL